jgi:hypothetical protein
VTNTHGTRVGVFGSSAFPVTAKPKMDTFQLDEGEYCKYPRMINGTGHGAKTTPASSSGKVLCSTNAGLVQRGDQMEQLTSQKLSPAFHTVFQTPGNSNKYQLQGWGPERGDQWAIGKAFADTFGKQSRSADSGLTPNVSFAGQQCNPEAPSNKLWRTGAPLEADDRPKGPYAQTLVQDRPFNGNVKK